MLMRKFQKSQCKLVIIFKLIFLNYGIAIHVTFIVDSVVIDKSLSKILFNNELILLMLLVLQTTAEPTMKVTVHVDAEISKKSKCME
jgi:hypothetical protein